MMPRINAYVLAAAPAWLEESIQSYYELVQRIVVSYDKSGRSWTGKPLPIDDCLTRLKSLDPHGKLDFRPDGYARSPGYFLEQPSRLWRRRASYPGPVAVRPGVGLRHARQGGTNLYVVGFSHEHLPLPGWRDRMGEGGRIRCHA